jgi:DNA-directed RNA polymerase II subunit RPB7
LEWLPARAAPRVPSPQCLRARAVPADLDVTRHVPARRLARVGRPACQLEMEKPLVLPPKDLRKNIRDLLRQKLTKLVEGSCSRRYGYIIAVTHIVEDHYGQGRICEGTGDVTFPMKYNAIVFKPFRNEVIDAVVTENVTKEGFFAKAGPLELFVSYKNMPADMKFDDNAVPPLFLGDGGIKVQKDTCVRLRILNTRIDADGMVCAHARDLSLPSPALVKPVR